MTVVVGGSIASLVTADRLAEAGQPVDLFLAERGLGGGFLPIPAKGRRLELGARLIELSYDDDPGEPPPLAEYRPGPHGHRPYLTLIDAAVRELAGGDLLALDPPQASIDGKRCTDYVLGGDLTGLVDVLDADELATMAAETAARVEAEGPHGAFAEDRESERWSRTFADVGIAHTGPSFHERLIESLASKMLPGGSGSVIGALHRKIWLPLFHPVTAWEACTGALTYRPQRPMWTLRTGGMGEVVQRLADRVRAASAVTVHEVGTLTGVSPDGTDGVQLVFEDGTEVTATRPVVGVGPDELFPAAGVPYESDRVIATMVWVEVAEAEVVDLPSVLFASEPDVGVFRVTENRADERPGHRTLCCELDHRRADPDGWAEVVGHALPALGVTTPGATIEIVMGASRPSFASPSFENQAAWSEARRQLDRLALPVRLVGGTTAFGADTFNEQLVQGLQVAEELLGVG
jgi:hypothetical protein